MMTVCLASGELPFGGISRVSRCENCRALFPPLVSALRLQRRGEIDQPTPAIAATKRNPIPAPQPAAILAVAEGPPCTGFDVGGGAVGVIGMVVSPPVTVMRDVADNLDEKYEYELPRKPGLVGEDGGVGTVGVTTVLEVVDILITSVGFDKRVAGDGEGEGV